MSNRTIAITESIYQYLCDHSLREDPILKDLRDHTYAMEERAMQIAPEQGQFMQMLVKLIGAKNTIEVGVFTGYSSLAIALALPEDGRIVACDVNPQYTSVAEKFWVSAGVREKIDLRIGPAKDTLLKLINAGLTGTFDFAFIDADKINYDHYYELCLQLIRPGGLITVDNVLWGGSVSDDAINDVDTNSIRALNDKLHQDERIDLSLVPVGDGLTLAMKRN
ncbi:MAG TPA: SAM-dependent methyltransferase [Candidatus Marinimicrobia bacterium]|nr:SAM-dependent methyltransferase [Candidatus Neomarinimicrobiota bacterium]